MTDWFISTGILNVITTSGEWDHRMRNPLGSFLTIQRPLFFAYTQCTDAIENCLSALYVSAALPYSQKLPTWVLLSAVHKVRFYSLTKSIGCNDFCRQLHIFHYLDASWSTLRSLPTHTGSRWLFSLRIQWVSCLEGRDHQCTGTGYHSIKAQHPASPFTMLIEG